MARDNIAAPKPSRQRSTHASRWIGLDGFSQRVAIGRGGRDLHDLAPHAALPMFASCRHRFPTVDDWSTTHVCSL
jgi:hypothetical protein